MPIQSFKDLNTEVFFLYGKAHPKTKWLSLQKIAKRKLDMLHYANNLQDLRSPPSNFLEALKGDLKGYYSIRINDQWRLIFMWDGQPYNVYIDDYH